MRIKAVANGLNQTEKAIYLTMFILLFQITRNISNIGYVGVLFSSYAWLYITYLLSNRNGFINIRRNFILSETVFILTLIWIPVISLINMTSTEYFNSIPRYLVTLPFIFFCAIYPKYDRLFINKTLKLFVLFSILAGGSIIFQLIFGPIPFFAEYSMRAGLIRYSSFAGSLTVMGTLGGIVLPFLMFTGDALYSNKKRNIMILLLLVGMMVSLQKSAIINIVIVFMIYFMFYKGVTLLKKLIAIVTILILFIITASILSDTIIFEYVSGLYNYTFTSTSFGVEQDLLKRLWELPSKVILLNKITGFDYLFGIGFPALAGTMGNTQYPMAHNNFFDLLFSGGVFHLLTYLWLLFRIPLSVLKKFLNNKNISYLDRSYVASTIVILSNMFVGAATFYQPVLSVIIFFIIFSYKRIDY